MVQESAQGDSGAVCQPWDPQRALRSADPSEVRFSRGFLRCRPERWFPAFAAQWLPLAHSLGAEVRVVEVAPLFMVPQGLEHGFTGMVDDEPVGLLLDLDSSKVVLEALTPGAIKEAQPIVLEYIARRFLSSLALSWSGPESSVVQFNPDLTIDQVPQAGAVKLTFMVNNNYCTIWVVMGRRLLERLDSLWRREVHTQSRRFDKGAQVRLEVAQLAVPPSMLGDYARSGAMVDLEVAASDQLILRVDGKPWLPARMYNMAGKLGFEIIAGIASQPSLPEGTTRVAIEFGAINLEPQLLAELSQVGAMFQTDLPISNQVHLTVNKEPVGEGILSLYEGRFAVQVR